MRVVHLIKATQIGGAERHLLWLLPALRRADVDARLLVLIEAGKPMDDLARLAEAEACQWSAWALRVASTSR